MSIRVSETDVSELYETLDKIGCLGNSRESGYLRAAYSDEETAAMKFIEEKAIQLGADAKWDAVGNLSLSWAGQNRKFVEVGSHLDTVPMGGNFDGVAGIVAGLLAISSIKRNYLPVKSGLRLRIWRAEESGTFNVLYGGSKAAFGQSDPASLTYRFRGTVYEDAMRSQNADPEFIRRREATITQEELDGILAHVELHIEQANFLERRNIDVGIITSIRAAKRFRVELTGEFDHSGATPMGPEYRKDANLAMAYIHVGLDELLKKYIDRGEDLVQTVGVINSTRDINESNPLVYTNALTVISGYGYFSWDIRSNKKATLERFTEEASKLVKSIAENFRVTAKLTAVSSGVPQESLSETIQAVMEKSATDLGISAVRMASGAGHDCAVVAQQKQSSGLTVPVGMLFIPCKNGKSHSPEEFATFEAIAKGASVLATGIYELART